MPNKAMRILIADEHPEQRLQLERMLNALGYYRIAPVESFDDLQRLVHSALQPFNLLIGNIELASHAGVDLARFCRVSTQIQHALLYQSPHLKVPSVPPSDRHAVSISLPRAPDSEALESFMAIIDLPVLVAQLPLPAGLVGGAGYARRRTNFGLTVFSRSS
ncbi:histidine kinase [Pseudomonas xantholysinigenes]|uniref:Histidine kinase n=1 Tax=Pseudomonas xantholysinigenes TaxID=2745490 RepID=A0A9E6TWH9_9PSED|nr:histidine kinase [Pseudomonas xantholysinigenes]QXI36940.1 histidine kinase [Pseudomonas xantholysinigenes]